MNRAPNSDPRHLGNPRVHVRQVGSTNALARELAAAGAPHGTLVTATEQLAGRGRQGRSWVAPPGSSLLCSWLIREPSRLLPLAAGAAVAETVERAVAGAHSLLKWPNDVLLDGRKVAGILVEGRPQERWAVLGVGLNVAVAPAQLPEELRERAGTLGLRPTDTEMVLDMLREALERWLTASDQDVRAAFVKRDALIGSSVSWAGGSGIADGIDELGRLVVLAGGAEICLDAGEVHLNRS